MEPGVCDKYVASCPPLCSLLVWALCLVRYFISSVNLNTKTCPSALVLPVHDNIAQAVGILLSLGMTFLGFTSLGGAFVSGCPFRSPFSSVIRFVFKILQTLSKRISSGCLSSKNLRWLWIGTLTFLWIASDAVVAYATLRSGTGFSLIFISAAFPFAYLAQQEIVHKPQKYKVSHLALWVFLFISLSMILAISFEYPTFTILYALGVSGIVFVCWIFSKISKSMADTGEIDVIAWLLTTTPPQNPATFFKKAGQMTGFLNIGCHYRPRLLESLMPHLTLLITSYHAPPEHHSSDTYSPSSKPRRNFRIELKREKSDDVMDGRYSLPTSLSLVDDDMGGPVDEDPHMKNLEIYIACLARLSEFKDYEGSFWCLWEDTMQHPKLEQPLIDKLVMLADPRHHFEIGLRSAATKVLNNYELDMEGNSLRSSATVLWSVATVLRSAATLMLNVSGLNSPSQGQGHTNLHRPVDPSTRVEPAHSSGMIEGVKREPDIGEC